MNYGQIRKYDVANGEGIRTSIFVTGCNHHCKGCFNEEYQDFDFGDKWTGKETREVIEDLKLPEVSGLTLIGGEPMEHPRELREIVEKIKSEVDKTIWIYSGFTYEKILEDEDKLALLKECDILVDGLFIEKELDLSLRFRGSRNQRVIDIQKSLANGEVTIWDKL
ncbi:anaerobic ribonucleoside-triphosphate reductase activating protein [Peptoniphilus sp.]|uniref:anaerobic ribonucleoside-triphosphate reductase activating protein n=1 Tax=Peptoniphilus sp. TaxID=1971214 RepID=UPI00399546DD